MSKTEVRCSCFTLLLEFESQGAMAEVIKYEIFQRTLGFPDGMAEVFKYEILRWGLELCFKVYGRDDQVYDSGEEGKAEPERSTAEVIKKYCTG